MISNLNKCTICPHNCKVNRNEGKIGFCKSDNSVKVALVSKHYYEEPCISGENGSGTIFFSNCNLRCVYCQNYEISQLGKGKEISIKKLADLFLKQQKDGANNINLVTPTMYVYQIIEAIKIARKNGLKIPIIYNSNGYENVKTIKKLKGYIDVYLPDFKYYYNELGLKYSGIPNYKENAINSIIEMYKQVGSPKFNKDGTIKKGLIIRHLVLPNNIQNSIESIKWINKTFKDKVYISIMAQYFPAFKAKDIEEINRKLNKEEYDKIQKLISDLDIKKGYIQELGEHEEEYVPKFDYSGLEE